MSVSVSTAKLNLILLAAANAANLLLLYAASHAPWPVAVAAALLFALSNNTVFALLHECVHGVFAPAANGRGGRLNEFARRTGVQAEFVDDLYVLFEHGLGFPIRGRR